MNSSKCLFVRKLCFVARYSPVAHAQTHSTWRHLGEDLHGPQSPEHPHTGPLLPHALHWQQVHLRRLLYGEGHQ